MTRIAVMVSGGGTNLQALLDAKARGEIPHGEFVLVLSSSPEAYALERAGKAGIDTAVVRRKDFPDDAAFDAAMEQALTGHRVDLVVMAGSLSILGPRVLNRYDRRIINIHPSLLPSFGGRGFYGLRVHRAALDRGVKVTGATVHYVSEEVDGGEILLQKTVPVLDGDTPEILQRRVMEQAEWELLPRAVAMLCKQYSEEK